MEMLFVMDPIEGINVAKDTTFALMRAAAQRGHQVSYCTNRDLGATGDGAYAHARTIEAASLMNATPAAPSLTIAAPTRRPLESYRAVWMRKDPPANDDYVYCTLLLERADPSQTLVLNRPSGLRAANEKAFILNFPDVIPATLITKQPDDIRAFCKEHGGRAVLKPLDLMGGAGIFMLHLDDPNWNVILEQSTRGGQEFVMIQRFVPEAREGDKRVLLIDGEPLGAVLRVPKAGEFRGNLAVGGKAVKAEVTARDRELVARVRERLHAEGLYFVGLDVIGGLLTEVNVTSPTGIQEIEKFDGAGASETVIAWVEQNAPAGA